MHAVSVVSVCALVRCLPVNLSNMKWYKRLALDCCSRIGCRSLMRKGFGQQDVTRLLKLASSTDGARVALLYSLRVAVSYDVKLGAREAFYSDTLPG